MHVLLSGKRASYFKQNTESVSSTVASLNTLPSITVLMTLPTRGVAGTFSVPGRGHQGARFFIWGPGGSENPGGQGAWVFQRQASI